jgi:hypothetical protein
MFLIHFFCLPSSVFKKNILGITTCRYHLSFEVIHSTILRRLLGHSDAHLSEHINLVILEC